MLMMFIRISLMVTRSKRARPSGPAPSVLQSFRVLDVISLTVRIATTSTSTIGSLSRFL
jgi:hypothetical protein